MHQLMDYFQHAKWFIKNKKMLEKGQKTYDKGLLSAHKMINNKIENFGKER